jgi:SPP1 gp7 family putative phage head morphogenesis protein
VADKQKPTDEAEPMSSSRPNPAADLFFGTAEKTVNESPYVPASMLKPYNPDDLYRKTGDYRLYEEMSRDDQIHVCQSLKRDLVVGSGWTIVTEDQSCNDEMDENGDVIDADYKDISEDKSNPGDPTEKKSFSADLLGALQTQQMQQMQDKMLQKQKQQAVDQKNKVVAMANQKIADDIYQRLEEDPDVSFDEQLEELITTGFDYGFAVSEKLFRIRDDNSLTWKEMKTRHPATWLLYTDKRGNMEDYVQRTREGNLSIEQKSLIHIINNRKWQNPYGTSDLRPAYDSWITKRHLHRYFAIFVEKYASPIPIAKYGTTTPKDKVREIFEIVKTFMQKTAMTIPKDIEIEFLESKNNGEAYIKGINLMNMFIGRSLMVPDLLGFSGSESQTGGSQALGREQMNVFMQHIKRRRRMIERIINKHIIQPLVVWNHGNVEMYPKFQFMPVSEQDAESYAKTFIEAMRGKAYVPNDEEINHFRSLIKFPEGKVERDNPNALDYSPALLGQQPGGPNDPNAQDPNNPAAGKQQPAPGGGKGKLPAPAVGKAPGKGTPTKPAATKKFATVFTTLGPYDAKVNYSKLESQLQTANDDLMKAGKELISEIFDDLIDQIQKLKVIGNANPDLSKLQSLKVRKKKEFQMLLKRYLTQFYYESKVTAREEITNNKGTYAKPMPSDAFLQYLEDDTFAYVKDWEYRVTQDARIAMQNAVKDGKPLSSVVSLLDTDGRTDSETSLDRYSRTKYTEVMNRGRTEEFEKSGVVQGYQYSAVMDDRTTDICAGLNGCTFKAGDEPIPPMHFNCRSLLVPITIFEDFTPTEKVGDQPIDEFIDENKGKGFSTR